MNGFGQNFRLSIFGESHSTTMGVVVDGVRAGLALSEADFAVDIARRRSGGVGSTTRREADVPRLVSGVLNGVTTGAPLAILFDNLDVRSDDYDNLKLHPRPSHADWVASQKWGGVNDGRGGGHFSGRLTLPIVAAGVVAKKMLGQGLTFATSLVEVGGQTSDFETVVERAMADGDSVGGVVRCGVEGLKVGVGSPFFDSVESVISHLLFAIPAVRGVEFGDGFAAAKMRGSEHNDPIIDAQGHTATNHAGGVVGGLATGAQLVVRVAIKPTSSIAKEQQTFNFKSGQIEPLAIKGRHDACIAMRASVVVEAAVAIALADLYQR